MRGELYNPPMRPTFLLRLVVLAVCAAAFAVVLRASLWASASIGVLAFLVLLWFIAIEGGALPALLTRLAVRFLPRGGRQRPSLWLVDADAEHGKRMEKLRAQSEQNTSL